jgi:hypothetical protein
MSVAIGVLLGAGCTHLKLERSTIRQAGTLTDLQYKQVLNNLAMFSCNPEALPWHVKVRGGTVQVTDAAEGEFAAEIPTGGEEFTKLLPRVGAQRTLLEQWDVDPTIEADELELLRLAYRKAVCPDDPNLSKDIYDAICELCLRYDILPDEAILQRILIDKDIITKMNEAIEKAIPPFTPGSDVKDVEKVVAWARGINQAGAIKDLPPEVVAFMKAAKEKENAAYAGLAKLIHLKLNVVLPLVSTPIESGKPGKALYGRALVGASSAVVRSPGVFRTMVDAPPSVNDPSSDYLDFLTVLQIACETKYLPVGSSYLVNNRNPGLIDQAADKIKKLQDLLEKDVFKARWFYCGKKKDVPKCACLVGHYCGCPCECYIWVMPEQAAALREFTLAVLSLAPIEKQDLAFSRGAGAAYSGAAATRR